jgi:arylsulfatase
MMGVHGIHDGWIASTVPMRAPWDVTGPVTQDPANAQVGALRLTKDWTQNNDMAAQNPEKLKEMQKLFSGRRQKYEVLPLDATVAARLVAPRPNITAGRNVFTYSGELTGIPTGTLRACSISHTQSLRM